MIETEMLAGKVGDPKTSIKKKSRRQHRRPKKEVPAVLVVVENYTGEGIDTVRLSFDSRKELSQNLFRDTHGRLRLDTPGEPFLSNKSGPAVIYTDDDADNFDFFIDGFPVRPEQVPWMEFDEVEMVPEGVVWQGIGGYNLIRKLEYGIACPHCEDGAHDDVFDDTHEWHIMLAFEEDFELCVSVGFSDLVLEADVLHNHTALNELEYFHTKECGSKILMEVGSMLAVPAKGFEDYESRFLTSTAKEELMKEIKLQTDAYVSRHNKTADKKNTSGFGKVAAAGLAMAAVGVAGAIAGHAAHKQLAAPAEVRV